MTDVAPFTENVSGKFRTKVRNEIKQMARVASSYLSEQTIYAVYAEEIQRLQGEQATPQEEDDELEEEDDLTPTQQLRARRLSRDLA